MTDSAGNLVAEGREEDLSGPFGPRWSTILLAWSIPAIISTLQAVIAYSLRDRLAAEWPWAIERGVKVFSCALVTPTIFKLGRRYPIVRGRYVRHGAIHAAIALSFAFVYEYLWFRFTTPLSSLLSRGPRQPLPPGITGTLLATNQLTIILGSLVSTGFIYVAVLAIGAMLDRDRRLRERDGLTAKLETQLARAQVDALKMRVHPHFLFNALHAVTVLIAEAPTAATLMVVRLGDLLRVSLARATSAEVTVEAELDVVRLYLAVEEVRFRDRLTVHYEIAADALHALVPDLVLQPLVENAIKHGFASVRDHCTITVRARREGMQLILDVEDNGRGLQVNATIVEGVGLATTRERLLALYGQDHSLVMITPASGGTLARMVLPFHTTPLAARAS